jgi:outer membrane biosynthesis protein TonB
MKRLSILFCATMLCVATGIASADETNFPSRTRTLETSAPAGCNDWVAPLPERRVKVTLPNGAKRYDGSANLTINISQDGQFGGLVEAITNDEVFVQAATESLRYWSFVPARCNGVPVATQAKVFFNFRQESFVSYATASNLRH